MPITELEGVDRRKNEQVHRQMQRFRNIASGLVAAVLIAALMGAFGSGPLNPAMAADRSGFSVEYPRMLRLYAPADMSLHVPATDAERPAEISFNENYVHAFDVVSITPAPSQTQSGGGRIVYGFDRLGGQPTTIRFRVRPVDPGRLMAEVTTREGGSVRIRQLVLP